MANRLVFFVGLVLLLFGCSATPEPQPAGRNFPLLAPESLGHSLSLSQMVVGEYEGKTYRMRYEVEILPSRLVIVGLSPLGLTLFTLVQEKDTVDIERYFENQPAFDPRYTLFDFYLAYWPLKVLQPVLENAGLIIEEDRDGSGRRVSRAEGATVATVSYSGRKEEGGKIVIQHFDIPYRLRISTLGRTVSR